MDYLLFIIVTAESKNEVVTVEFKNVSDYYTIISNIDQLHLKISNNIRFILYEVVSKDILQPIKHW